MEGRMRILVYGAGVLGSLYAARLYEAGHDVTILARGERLADIESNGILLRDALTAAETRTRVRATTTLAPHDAYDLIVVLVRKDQVAEVLPALAANTASPTILFMVNNPSGHAEWIEAVGRERILVGFAGAGGTRSGDVVSYAIAPAVLQPTTFGEIDGTITPRLRGIAAAFRDAGFPVALSHNIDAWQKTHVAWVGPLANAIYAAGGSNYRMVHTRDALVLLVRAVREGFALLSALGVPVTPLRLRAWQFVPEPVLVGILSRALDTRTVEVLATRHALAAREEMQQLGDEFRALTRGTGVPTPAMDCLAEYGDASKSALPEGTGDLSLRWMELWQALAVLGAMVLVDQTMHRMVAKRRGGIARDA